MSYSAAAVQVSVTGMVSVAGASGSLLLEFFFRCMVTVAVFALLRIYPFLNLSGRLLLLGVLTS